MVRALINFGESHRHVAGIQVQGRATGGYVFSYCILQLEKQTARVLRQRAQIATLEVLSEELTQHLPPGARVHLNYDGAGLLSKTFDPAQYPSRIDDIGARLFPMVQGNDFIAQLAPGARQDFFTIARKNVLEYFEPLLSRYSWVSVSFGVFVISDILSLVEAQQIALPGYSLTVAGARIESVEPVSDVPLSPWLKIGQEQVSTDTVLAYASACHILVPEKAITVSGWTHGEAVSEAYAFKKKLFGAARIALFSVLGILLVNAVVFFSIQPKVAELEAEKTLTSGRREAAGKKQKQLASLKAIYDATGWDTNQRPLYHADQLALQVTDEIQLTRLEIGVLDDVLLRAEKRYTYNPALIRVQGMAANPVALRQWVSAVEQLAWVDQTYAEKYQHDRKLGKGMFEFFIRLR